ncbi:cytotoxic necrotizing factor Rho-activating domain-containing protein [Paraburkholderia sp. GAS348]|uniref:cytotoxic necrotizing factor Rho-activating domain-containing protein n=1 Tax=Paraburkholderia sp. GAS348 TaxID=3035132 RepID=UPI003D1F0354
MRSYTEDERVDGRQNAGTKKRTRKRARKRTRTGNRAIRVADLIGQDGAWNFDEFDAVPYLITQIPGWAGSGLALEVEANGIPTQRFGGDGGDAIRVRLRNNGLRDAHYSAVVNGTEVPVRDDGNCFFYAVWEALQDHRHEAAAHRIFNGREPLTRLEAARYFRRAIREYVIQNPERFNEITGSLTGADEAEEVFFDAPEHAEWLPEPVSQMASASTRNRAASTELSRTLFHLGNQATDWIGQSALTRILFQQLSAFSPVLSFYASYAVSAYRLVTALIRRDVLDGLMQTLLMLPYQLLSPPMCLLAIAEQTKRYIDSVLGWDDIQSLDADDKDQRETIYMCVGIVALITQYLYFKRTKIAFPETELGKKLVGMFGLLKRATQGYAVLQTLVDTVPVPSTTEPNAVVDPNALGYDPHDYRVQKSAAEKQWQRRHARIQKRLAIVERQEQLAEIRSRASKAAGGASNGDTGTPAPARSGAADAAVSKPLIVAGAVAASHTVVNMGAGAADVVERSALLADQEIAAVATTSRVQSLVRKSPLAGGVVGAAAAAGYGLYRLVSWLEQSDSGGDAPQNVAYPENATSATSEGVDATTVSAAGSTAMHDASDGLSSSTSMDRSREASSGTGVDVTAVAESDSPTEPTYLQSTAVQRQTDGTRQQGENATEGISESAVKLGMTQPFAASTEATGQPWPSGMVIDEMVDDFIITVTEEDDEFLRTDELAVPVEGGMSSDLIDFVLYSSDQVNEDEPSNRSRRSANAEAQGVVVPAATSELNSWISRNWPESESFKPGSDDVMVKVGKEIFKAKNGQTYMLVGGNYWKFVPKSLVFGELKNEISKRKFLLYREMPNFVWGFTRADRAKLKLGPIPDVDIPKPAVVSEDLSAWVTAHWGHSSAIVTGGGVRISDGIYEAKNRNLFLKVNNGWWKFEFLADRTRAELFNQKNGESVSLKFDGATWARYTAPSSEVSTPDASRLDNSHIIENLFSYDFYSNEVKIQLKEIVRAVLSGKEEIKYSELVDKVGKQCAAWFAQESQKENSTMIAEVMLARGEMEIRRAHLRLSGRNDASGMKSLWEYYNLEIDVPLLQEYDRSLSLGAIDDAVFIEALTTTDEDNRFTIHRNRLQSKIDELVADTERLTGENDATETSISNAKSNLKNLRGQLDALSNNSKGYTFIKHLRAHNINIVKNRIRDKSKEFISGSTRLNANNNKIKHNHDEIARLKNELSVYNWSVDFEEGRLTRYREGIEKARQVINQTLRRGAVSGDVLSCAKKSRVAHYYTLINTANEQLAIKRLVRDRYTVDEVTALEKLDVVKKYLYTSSQLSQEYFYLLNELPIAEIRKITVRGDYRDIISAQIAAAKFYKKSKGSLSKSDTRESLLDEYHKIPASDDEAQGFLLLTAATIYGIMKRPGGVLDCVKVSPDLIVSEFTSYKISQSPLARMADKPEGFFSIGELKDSNQFVTQLEFTNQFSDYVEKFSRYESDLLSIGLLVSSGLSMLELYTEFINFYRFNLVVNHGNAEIVGGVAFVELYNGDWLVVSCLLDSLKAKRVSKKKMSENKYLRFLIKHPSRERPRGNGKRPLPRVGSGDKNFNAQEWRDLKKYFIVPFLGGRSAYAGSEPLLLNADNPGKYSKSNGLLLGEMQVFVQECMNEMARGLKNYLYYPNFWQKLSLDYVPLYRQFYNWKTDKAYEPDLQEILFDVIVISMIMFSKGKPKINLMLGQGGHGLLVNIFELYLKNKKAGLAGWNLVGAVLAQMPITGVRTGVKAVKITLSGLYDLIEPVPLRTAIGGFYKCLIKPTRALNRGFFLGKVTTWAPGDPANPKEIPVASRKNVGATGEINESWQRAGISLDGMIKGEDSPNKGVYRNPRAGSSTGTSTDTDSSDYYIKDRSAIYEVRWDEYARTWRVIDPGHPGKFSYAVPVKLNEDGRWVTHNDVPGKGGDARDQFEGVAKLPRLSENQVAPVRNLLAQARDKSLDIIDNYEVAISNKKNNEEIDNLMDIFLGRHDEPLKNDLMYSLKRQRKFIETLEVRKDVNYRGGYSREDITNVLESEFTSSAEPKPAMTAYVDAIVDAGNENFRSKDELVNFMSAMMLRQSRRVHGFEETVEGYVKISGSSLDVSDILKPGLIGKDKIPGADNISCFLMQVYYLKKYPDLYGKFLNNYNDWKVRPDDSLTWIFPGHGTENPFPLVQTDKGEIRHGLVRPLIGRGILSGKSTSDPGVSFHFVRSDALIDTTGLPPQVFSMSEITEENGRLHGVVDISTGDQISSASKNGPVIGSWGGENVLDDNVIVIDVSNGQSSTIGIAIPLDQLKEGKPIIISAGELSGCSMIYAVRDNTLYAFHAGQKSGDSGWLTSREGAASIYKAHLAFNGKVISDFEIKENRLIDGNGMSVSGNDALVKIFSTYDRSTINYFGKSTPNGESARPTEVRNNVNQFDYNGALSLGDPRVGVAYALLVKDKGKVKVTSYSEDMSVKAGGGQPKYITLANSEYVIKYFDDSLEKRKFEEVRLIDESSIPRGPDVEEKKSFLETVFSQDNEILSYIRSPYENSRNAVRRFWHLFDGRENSGIVREFNTEGLAPEMAEKVRGLKDLVQEGGFSLGVRAMNYWENGEKSWSSSVHFAFMLNFRKFKIILDTPGAELPDIGPMQNIGVPLIKLEQRWVKDYQEAFSNTTATVKYKDFESYEDALDFSPAYPVEARTFVDGAYLLQEPDWYRQDGPFRGADVMPTHSPSSVVQFDPPEIAIEDVVQSGLPDTSLETGLIHFFPFDGGLADTIAPGVTVQPFDGASSTGEALVADNFSGTAMRVSSLDSAAGALNGMRLIDDVSTQPQFTIGFWFKSDGAKRHHAPVLCNKDWSVGTNPGFVIDQQKDNQLKFNVGDGTQRADVFIPFTGDTWVYVALTVDTVASTATAYVGDPSGGLRSATLKLNGMDMKGIAGTHSTIAFNEDALGNYYSRRQRAFGTATFNNVAMWNRVLTQEQVKLLFMSGLPSGQEPASPGDVSPALATQSVGPEPIESGVEEATAAVDEMPHAFTGVLSADQASLTLSWTAPENRPEAYFLYRDNKEIATLSGDATSYVDSGFGGVGSGNYVVEYALTTNRGVTVIPMRVKLTYLRPDTDVASGLIHFFSFDDGLADAIVPDVSIRPFDSASKAARTQVADSFRGHAMQVTPQNIDEGALNGMKLADDVSTHAQFSIGFWFKSNGAPKDSPVLGNKDWAAGVNPGFVISHHRDGVFRFNVADGSQRADLEITFTTNRWVYVVMTVDTIARMATAYVYDPVKSLRIAKLDLAGFDVEKIRGVYSTIGFNEDARGDYYSRGQGVPGTMCYNDVAMWSRVLTKQEVLSLSKPTYSLSVSPLDSVETVVV